MTSNTSSITMKKRNLNIFLTLTKRHLKMILSNKIRMFYTLMVPIIILVIYIIFLRDMELNAVKVELLNRGIDTNNAELMKHICLVVDAWMLSGIVSISSITISLQTNSLIVEDKENGINKDFVSSPINKNILIASYFVYNFIITLVLSFLVLITSFIFLAAYGEMYLGFTDTIMMFGTVFLTTIPTTLLTVFICIFIKTEPVLASVIAIFSAAIGFLTGAYMPISLLAKPIQYLCAFIPGTYTCSLIRFSFLNNPILSLEAYLNANPGILPATETPASISNLIINNFGYNVNFFEISLTPAYSVVATTIFFIIFLVLNLIFCGRLAKIEDKPIMDKMEKLKLKMKCKQENTENTEDEKEPQN